MMKGGKGRRMMKAMQAEMPEGNPSLPGMPKL
jgi:hypothetical protein